MKTPEELASEYGNTIHKDQDGFDLDDCRWSHITEWEKRAFLAGYAAAKDQLADADKSDGYHTFNELYEHRTLLFLSALKAGAFKAQMVCEDHYPEWDVITCYTPNNYEQISYHVPIKYRDFYSHLDRCSKEQQENNFDGHDSKLVAQRIKKSLLQTNLPTPAKWISVKERLPEFDKDGYTEDVLLRRYDEAIYVSWFKKQNGLVTGGSIYRLDQITHWMPLPEPPKENE